MKVYKFPVKSPMINIINMPIGAQILSADLQNGQLIVWALVDENAKYTQRTICSVGTGVPMPDLHRSYYYRFISTVVIKEGGYAAHVFEVMQITHP